MQTLLGVLVLDGMQLLWIWAPLAVIVGAGLRFAARDPERRSAYGWLLLLLAPWSFSAFWIVLFQDHPPGPPMRNPAAVSAVPLLGVAAELILAVVLVVRLKTTRIAAAALGLLNLYISVLVWVWGVMASSGASI
jgi:hypothetical protein